VYMQGETTSRGVLTVEMGGRFLARCNEDFGSDSNHVNITHLAAFMINHELLNTW
jgi:hypothetical protein